jgi:hypothetical protein
VRYRLSTLLAIGVCAMTAAGHNSLVAIAEWAHRCDHPAVSTSSSAAGTLLLRHANGDRPCAGRRAGAVGPRLALLW